MRPFLRRYGAAVLLVVVIFAVSPVIGGVRDLVFAIFPERGAAAVAGPLILVAAGAALWGLTRIRTHRRWRYGGLAVACGLVALSTLLDAGDGGARVSVVEKVHILEYGLLAALLYRARRQVGDLSLVLLPLLWTTLAGTLEEGLQWLVPRRVGEIRDVGINAWAALCGVVFALAVAPPEGFRAGLDPRSRRLVAGSAALVVLALAAFWSSAHAGHWIEHPEVGRFRSWHTAAELRATAERRAREWTAAPPTAIPAWGIEDRFLTEAAAHVLFRNHAWQYGDARDAWHANRVLELFYAPFLDTRSITSGEPHRLATAERAELERRGAPRRAVDYTSPVLAGRVRTEPPRAVVLGLAAAVAALLWLLGRWPRTADRGVSRRAPSPRDAPGARRS